MNIENIQDLRILVETARGGTLSAAARRLGLTPAAASAALKRLETQLALRLFERSTRAMRLTEAGQTLLAYAERALDLLNEGVAQADNARGGLTGVIRLAAPQGLAHSVLLPWLDDFLRAHSGVRLHLTVGDRLQDLLRDEIDLALRFGTLPDSALVARPLCATARIVCAAPDYLARTGAPAHPNELPRHNCLTFDANGRRLKQWSLVRGSETCTVQVDGDRHSNDAALALRWALLGRGLVFKAEAGLRSELACGALVRVLPEWQGESYPLHAVLPSRRFVPQRVRVLVDFLAGKFAAG